MNKTVNQMLIEELEALHAENIELKAIITKCDAQVSSWLQAIPDLAWLKDDNGIYLNCNKAFEKFFNRTKENIIGKTDCDFVDKGLADYFLAHDRLVMLKGVPLTNEEWVTSASGQQVLFETIKAPMRNSQNELIGILGVSRDITERRRTQEQLEFQRQILLTQMETSHEGIYILDENTKILYLNQQAIDIWTFPKDVVELARASADSDVLLQFIMTLVVNPASFIERVKYIYSSTSEYFHDEIRLKDGRYIDRWSGPIITKDNKFYGRVIYFRDITERKNQERNLKLLTAALNHLPDTAMLMDEQLNFIYVNEACIKKLGYSKEEMRHMTPVDIDPDFSAEELIHALSIKQTFHPDSRFERRHRARDGHVFPVQISLSIVEYDGVNYCISLCQDITDRKTQEEELNHVANHDVLTGLPNRRLFTDRINQAIVRAKRNHKILAVCYLDLDNFKPVNDLFGHEIGDALLVEIAQQIANVLREGDTVARLGGDEFAILLNDLDDEANSRAIMTRLLSMINQKKEVQGHPIDISASIGGVLYYGNEIDADWLLRFADQAMYIAKSQGKNGYHQIDRFS
jgi:diguanylate cyclase (GGDEF)-like protein/PAS domain S-box-containing protein